MPMFKIISKSIFLILVLALFLAPSAQAKKYTTVTKKCEMGHYKGEPSGYFKTKIFGKYSGKFFIITKIKYGFGPSGHYGNKSNLEARYKKARKSNKIFKWKSDDNLVSDGAMRTVPKKTRIVVARGAPVFIKGIADRSRDSDPRCSNAFTF